jgi:hypothetical protein
MSITYFFQQNRLGYTKKQGGSPAFCRMKIFYTKLQYKISKKAC